ncbi:MAG: hypothetical protein HC911_16875 [Chloroflexaceae bacterium]|nr:hypothetical protein [Chloroflexaceae bacterium]
MRVYTQSLVLLMLIVLSVGNVVQADEPPAADNRTQYLPLIVRAEPPAPACAPVPEEAELAARMQTHPDQKRPFLVCDPTLERIAREMAQDMSVRDFFNHVNPDGIGPNELVRRGGYPLTSGYDPTITANNIQSIGRGGTLEQMWPLWMNSDSHRLHLIGDGPFWIAQTDYGIGYYYDPNSPSQHYWVILTARKEGSLQ